MSNASEKLSGRDQDPQENDSVFDFLYHDPQRIGSFLSQMDPGGHLKAFKRTRNVNDAQSDAVGGSVGGDILVAKGKATATTTVSSQANDGSETTYDPLWTNARAFLDFLAQRDLIQRDLPAARIGQFVLTAGELTVLDFVMLRGMWKLPAVQHFIKRGSEEPAENRHARRSNATSQKTISSKAEPTEMDLALELMDVLPHSVQGRFATDHGQMWTSLSVDCLVTTPSDLLLKHGLTMPGEWSVLGILDAYPDSPNNQVSLPTMGGMSDILPTFLSALTPITRGMLGRPESAFAMTPLLIFREVTGQ